MNGALVRPLLGVWAAWLLLALLLLCAAGPRLSRVDANAVDLSARLRGPSRSHPLGTDEVGRDVLVRLMAGGRVSLVVGFGAGLLAGAIGSAVGLAAAWLGGPAGAALMRLTDLALSFPSILTLLFLSTFLGHGVPQLAGLIGATLWMSSARLVRGRALELQSAGYVEAAMAIGASTLRVLTRHVLPNVRETLIVAFLLAINHAIQAESTVSFLGLGIQPPLASWGTMLTNAQAYLSRNPWLAVGPGAAIALTVLSSYVVARSLAAPRRSRGGRATASRPGWLRRTGALRAAGWAARRRPRVRRLRLG